jgi:hypothetical protein
MEQLLPMVKEEAVDASDSDHSECKGDISDNNNQKQICREPPHFTFDNYVADNKILNLFGEALEPIIFQYVAHTLKTYLYVIILKQLYLVQTAQYAHLLNREHLTCVHNKVLAVC